jgi:ABC-type dipeptide/oligopeptide/nickel transport system ATPase component
MSAILGAIVGESGTGKSTSIRTLNPEETFIINVTGKALPFKGFKRRYKNLKQDPKTKKFEGNLYHTDNVTQILKILKIVDKTMPNIKQVLIEDSQYLMAFEAMERAEETGYSKFTEIAQHFYSVLKEAINMRDDLKIFILTHSENVGDSLNPSYKIKTIGKMIDSMITLEGLFTYVFFTTRIKDENDELQYKFITNSDGTNTAKTPMGCFSEKFVDNDLQQIFNTIDKYNNED